MGKRGRVMAEPELTESDNEDIEDAFAAGRSKVAFGKEQGGDEDSLDEEAVYDLSDDASESGSEEDDSEEDDELDLDEEIERGGKAGRLARQARYLEERLKLQQREDEDEGPPSGEGEEDEAAARERLWGASKRAYYGGDDAEVESDEEALKGEEEEAARLQAQRAARLGEDDYGLGDEPSPGDAAAGDDMVAAPAAGRRRVEIEAVAKDLSALTKDERMSALLSDAPELPSLLEELQAALAELRHRTAPLLQEVREGGLATPDGLRYLEARHAALSQYAALVAAYLLLKAEGRSVRHHPVIGRLVQLRGVLDSLAPIDQQLGYQADKLLRATRYVRAASTPGEEGAGDEDKQQQQEEEEEEEEEEKEREAAAAAAGEGAERRRRAEERRRRDAKRRAKRSSMLVRELEEELAGVPAETKAARDRAARAAALAARQRAEAAADAAAAAEVGPGGLSLTRLDAKRLKAQRKAGLPTRALLSDIADEVADLVAPGPAARLTDAAAGLTQLFGRQRLSQKFGADITAQLRSGRGGDDDLPTREPLHERRAKFDAVAARRAAAAEEERDDFDYEAAAARKRRGRDGEEGGDDFYAAAKAARSATKADKKSRRETPGLLPPLPDATVDGQRPISYAIQKNRGLTPHRRKDLKNPRKKHRIKFASAQVRRKGQVQGVREAPDRGYSGEATGVKARVAKSRRLG